MDVACMDISLPGMSGIEATRRLLAMKPDVRVIGLSAYAEPHYVHAIMNAGAVGHFTKGDAGESLLQAIRTATRDRPCFGAGISFPVAADPAATAAPDRAPSAPDAGSLGARELEVLLLIAGGSGASQISRALAMDPALVDVYRRNIMRKLRLVDEAALTDYARAWALRRDGGTERG
jgi:two-component system NarL family response regulator